MTKGPLPPYGVAIQEAIASRDLQRMRQVANEAEKYVARSTELRPALELLKKEIAKLERRG